MKRGQLSLLKIVVESPTRDVNNTKIRGKRNMPCAKTNDSQWSKTTEVA